MTKFSQYFCYSCLEFYLFFTEQYLIPSKSMSKISIVYIVLSVTNYNLIITINYVVLYQVSSIRRSTANEIAR